MSLCDERTFAALVINVGLADEAAFCATNSIVRFGNDNEPTTT